MPLDWSTVLVRMRTADLGSVWQRISSAIQALQPYEAVPEPELVTSRISDIHDETAVITRLLSIFSGLGLVLAVVGLGGVVNASIARRQREFAIRIALGADSRRVAALVARQASLIVSTGGALGLAGAYALGAMLRLTSRLFGVGRIDRVSYTVKLPRFSRHLQRLDRDSRQEVWNEETRTASL